MVKFAITAFLATAFWILPSVGTRGQGTLGDRFAHADRNLVPDNAAGHALLQSADAKVSQAIAGL